MGGCVGTLSPSAANHLGLSDYYGTSTKTDTRRDDNTGSDNKGNDNREDDNIKAGGQAGVATTTTAELAGLRVTVTQGGPDAYVGMLGLGCVQAGQLALITGSR